MRKAEDHSSSSLLGLHKVHAMAADCNFPSLSVQRAFQSLRHGLWAAACKSQHTLVLNSCTSMPAQAGQEATGGSCVTFVQEPLQDSENLTSCMLLSVTAFPAGTLLTFQPRAQHTAQAAAVPQQRRVQAAEAWRIL